MGGWIEQNLGLFFSLLGTAVSALIFVIRMEGKVARLDERITACEKRADEDRGQIKDRLDSIESTVSATKSAVDQIVGALRGRRVSDLGSDSLERL